MVGTYILLIRPGTDDDRMDGAKSASSIHGSDDRPAPAGPRQGNPEIRPGPATSDLPDPSPANGPAEKPITGDVSREALAGIRTTSEAARAHRMLTAQLLQRLEELGGITDRERIRVATQELADRFYLLDRVVSQGNLDKPGPASFGEEDRARISSLHRIWQTNMELSLTVDLLFSQRDLLTHEHVPQMFRHWMDLGAASADDTTEID